MSLEQKKSAIEQEVMNACNRGAFAEALELSEQYVALDPNDILGWGNIARLKVTLGLGDALQACEEWRRRSEEALQKNPEAAAVWYQHVEALFELARYNTVLEMVESKLKESPQFLEGPLFWQAKALGALGQKEEEKEVWSHLATLRMEKRRLVG